VPNTIQLPAADLAAIPYADQYFGVWAMREQNLLSLWHLAGKFNVNLHMQSSAPAAARAAASDVEVRVENGIAVIGLSGSLMKQSSSFSSSSSTVLARRKIRAAIKNPDVAGILLLVESPGGTVAGTKELADDVAAANKQKPVWAYCDDLCASAAYWIASQADKVFANSTAIVGSIGTYAVIQDYSAMAAKEGIKVHVVKAGEFKGAGTPGTEITAEQLADWQARVNELNEFFIAGVASGRKLTAEQARGLADGRVYIGAAAQSRRLIDGVQTLDQTFSQFQSHVQSRRSKKMDASQSLEQNAQLPDASSSAAPIPAATAPAATAPAAASPPASRPASVAELKAACPGASADFIVSQIEAGATVQTAQTAFVAEQNRRIADLQQQVAAKPAAAPKPAPGVKPTPASSTEPSADVDGDPVAAWNQAVADEQKSGCSRAVANQRVANKNPQLREAYVAAYNRLTPEQRRAG